MQFQKIIITVLCFSYFFVRSLSAQEATVAAGGDHTGAGGSVSFSVGQSSFTTYNTANGSISEGVQQPFEIFLVSGVAEWANIRLYCSAFPNPTSAYLTILVEEAPQTNVFYQLSDNNGKIIESRQIMQTETIIDLQSQPSAVYYLRVLENNREIKTFKIIKN